MVEYASTEPTALISTGTERNSALATFTGKAVSDAAMVTVLWEQPASSRAQAATTAEREIFICIRHHCRSNRAASLHSPAAERYPIPGCGGRWPSGSLRKSGRRRAGPESAAAHHL